jgi:hypothetical protein
MRNPQSPQQSSHEPQRPILRAVMMSVALCLLGLAIFIQTGQILFLAGGAALGAFALFTSLRQRHQIRGSGRPQSSESKLRGSSPTLQGRKSAKSAPGAKQAGSNVTPFRRPAPKDSTSKSNWPSA